MRVSFPFKPCFTVAIRASERPQRPHTGPDTTPSMVPHSVTTFSVGNASAVPPKGYSILIQEEQRERSERAA